MKKFVVLCLMLLFALTLVASDTHTPPAPTPADIAAGKVKFLNLLLNLTVAQQASATTLYTAAETSKVPVKTSLETAQTALVTAILANDSAGITTASNNLGTANAQLALIDAKADAAFNQLLTSEQKTKFGALLTEDFDIPIQPGRGTGPGQGHGNGH